MGFFILTRQPDVIRKINKSNSWRNRPKGVMAMSDEFENNEEQEDVSQNEGVDSGSPVDVTQEDAEETEDNIDLQDDKGEGEKEGKKVPVANREKEALRHATRAKEILDEISRGVSPQQYQPQIAPVQSHYYQPPPVQQPTLPIVDESELVVPPGADPKWLVNETIKRSTNAAIKAVVEHGRQQAAITRTIANYPDITNSQSPLFIRTAQILQQYGGNPNLLEAASAQAAAEFGILPVKFKQPTTNSKQQPLRKEATPGSTETVSKKPTPKGPQLSERQSRVGKQWGQDPKRVAQFI